MDSTWMNHLIGNIRGMGLNDYLDILVVAFLVYYMAKLIKETRAMQLLKGMAALALIYFVAAVAELETLQFIMNTVISTGVLALVILFQPELRRVLERVAQTRLGTLKTFFGGGDSDEANLAATSECIDIVCEACKSLSKTRTGALMVFERETKLGEIIKTGTVVDAAPSTELIGNLFYVNTPLHDGAMVIRDGRLYASGCFLPLSQNYTISKEMGTRHRAALGMSENSDALVVVVSEETGVISVAENGKIDRNYNTDGLKKRLRKGLLKKQDEAEKQTKEEESAVKALLKKVKR
ncbi:MAG: diadenylate cyclase CdaA [Oscillospiraceae bacterium]|nr:diadenylate cyclase CdaA [Oscillospiraceae bacterium]